MNMIVSLAGGVGGAKLAEGLAQIVGDRLTMVVNTADDFEHYGLLVCPDLDTIMYTLAGIANPITGWGVRDETWQLMDQLVNLGGAGWFKLGDRDLAVHLIRTDLIRRGKSLTEVTRILCEKLGIESKILPMTNDRVSTTVFSEGASWSFQEYFVAQRCEPAVTGFSFDGAAEARPTDLVKDALKDTRLAAILLGPSNPYVSIDPILSVPGMKDLLTDAGVPIVAVSPIIHGRAVKGPAAKMMQELGHDVSPLEVAKHYGKLLSGIVIDNQDRDYSRCIEALGIQVLAVDTLMQDADDRKRVATACLTFASEIARPTA